MSKIIWGFIKHLKKDFDRIIIDTDRFSIIGIFFFFIVVRLNTQYIIF